MIQVIFKKNGFKKDNKGYHNFLRIGLVKEITEQGSEEVRLFGVPVGDCPRQKVQCKGSTCLSHVVWMLGISAATAIFGGYPFTPKF